MQYEVAPISKGRLKYCAYRPSQGESIMVIKLPKNCDAEIIKYSKVIVIQQTFFL